MLIIIVSFFGGGGGGLGRWNREKSKAGWAFSELGGGNRDIT